MVHLMAAQTSAQLYAPGRMQAADYECCYPGKEDATLILRVKEMTSLKNCLLAVLQQLCILIQVLHWH